METTALSPQAFVDEMRRLQADLLSRLEPEATLVPDDPRLDIPNLLRAALRNEFEATDIAARWIPLTDDPEIKLAFARQVGDESRTDYGWAIRSGGTSWM